MVDKWLVQDADKNVGGSASEIIVAKTKQAAIDIYKQKHGGTNITAVYHNASIQNFKNYQEVIVKGRSGRFSVTNPDGSILKTFTDQKQAEMWAEQHASKVTYETPTKYPNPTGNFKNGMNKAKTEIQNKLETIGISNALSSQEIKQRLKEGADPGTLFRQQRSSYRGYDIVVVLTSQGNYEANILKGGRNIDASTYSTPDQAKQWAKREIDELIRDGE